MHEASKMNMKQPVHRTDSLSRNESGVVASGGPSIAGAGGALKRQDVSPASRGEKHPGQNKPQ